MEQTRVNEGIWMRERVEFKDPVVPRPLQIVRPAGTLGGRAHSRPLIPAENYTTLLGTSCCPGGPPVRGRAGPSLRSQPPGRTPSHWLQADDSPAGSRRRAVSQLQRRGWRGSPDPPPHLWSRPESSIPELFPA